MTVKKAKGYRLEVTFVDGTRGFRNYEGFTKEQLSKKLKALGGKFTEGIRQVHSIESYEWDQESIGAGIL
jgi:hypothetical protein